MKFFIKESDEFPISFILLDFICYIRLGGLYERRRLYYYCYSIIGFKDHFFVSKGVHIKEQYHLNQVYGLFFSMKRTVGLSFKPLIKFNLLIFLFKSENKYIY